jgi:hypothetical protein
VSDVLIPQEVAEHLLVRLQSERKSLLEMKTHKAVFGISIMEAPLNEALKQNEEDLGQMTTALLNAVHGKECRCKQPETQPNSQTCLACGGEWKRVVQEPRKARIVHGSWPENCVQRSFVAGAKWWQFKANGATAFPSEVDEMEEEALRRYGSPFATTAFNITEKKHIIIHDEVCLYCNKRFLNQDNVIAIVDGSGLKIFHDRCEPKKVPEDFRDDYIADPGDDDPPKKEPSK